MKNWSYWLPDVLPHVVGCPIPIAEHEIKRSAQSFFRESKSWRVEVGPFSVTANQETVSISAGSADLEILEVEPSSVYYDGDRLTSVTPQVLGNSFCQNWRDERGQPERFYFLSPEEMRLYPIPNVNATTGIACRVHVLPSDDATGIDDAVARKFREPIYIGARARLMLYPNVAWSNPNMAAVYGQAFATAVSKAKEEAARAYSQARITAYSRSKWC